MKVIILVGRVNGDGSENEYGTSLRTERYSKDILLAESVVAMEFPGKIVRDLSYKNGKAFAEWNGCMRAPGVVYEPNKVRKVVAALLADGFTLEQ